MVKIESKKGIVKIFEAAISITLIFTFMLLIYAQGIQKPRSSENILQWQGSILDEMKNDPALRAVILNNEGNCEEDSGLASIKNFIGERINNSFPGFGFTCRVCNATEVCGLPTYMSNEVFSEERIVSATLTEFSPKKIRMFMWKE